MSLKFLDLFSWCKPGPTDRIPEGRELARELNVTGGGITPLICRNPMSTGDITFSLCRHGRWSDGCLLNRRLPLTGLRLLSIRTDFKRHGYLSNWGRSTYQIRMSSVNITIAPCSDRDINGWPTDKSIFFYCESDTNSSLIDYELDTDIGLQTMYELMETTLYRSFYASNAVRSLKVHKKIIIVY